MKILVRFLIIVLIAAGGVFGYFHRDRIAYSFTELKNRYNEFKHGPPVSPVEQWRYHAQAAYDMLLNREYEEAFAEAEKALKIAETETPDAGLTLLSPSLRLRGFCYAGTGDYQMAGADFNRAVSIIRQGETPGKLIQAEHLKNLADMHMSAGKIDLAEPLYIEALQLIDIGKKSNFEKTAWICYSLGNVNFLKEDFDLAEQFYQRALDFMEKWAGPEHRKSIPLLTALGNIQMVRKEYDGAESSFRRALIINEAERGPYDLNNIPSLKGLANIHILKERYTSAVSSVNRIIRILEKNPEYGVDHLDEHQNRLERLMEIRRNKS